MVGGDSETDFEKLYERAFAPLMRILVRMVGSAEAAEDICQEVFIKLHERTAGFPKPEEALYWLIRVAKNMALNHEKRKGREAKAYKKSLDSTRGKGRESGEEAVLKDEAFRRVQEALLRLPKKLREVLILKEYGEFSYKEIAAILKTSEGNVKVRAYRAREWLAGFFKNSEEIHVP
ncbi:MAG: RNA polymerase sigma factor [Spirochaetales bacterium]|jgi:RNA polymerase sigma-70 factor (ECF subfamily)|nr:RNA polymerase sigma factor [Spirochaetales bacterium]